MNEKLVVKWSKVRQEFIVTHPSTNVLGYGITIRKAVENWQWWWEVPY